MQHVLALGKFADFQFVIFVCFPVLSGLIRQELRVSIRHLNVPNA